MTQMSVWLAFIAKIKSKAIQCSSSSSETIVCADIGMKDVEKLMCSQRLNVEKKTTLSV